MKLNVTSWRDSYVTLTCRDGTIVTLENVRVMDSAPKSFAEHLHRETPVPVPVVRGPSGPYALACKP